MAGKKGDGPREQKGGDVGALLLADKMGFLVGLGSICIGFRFCRAEPKNLD